MIFYREISFGTLKLLFLVVISREESFSLSCMRLSGTVEHVFPQRQGPQNVGFQRPSARDP